jgi:hypothetical protein
VWVGVWGDQRGPAEQRRAPSEFTLP